MTLNVTNLTVFVSAHVGSWSAYVVLEFIETLFTTPPPISAIAVTVDGEAATIESVNISDKLAHALAANRVCQDQTVSVALGLPPVTMPMQSRTWLV